jgi:diadenosine tetraphosphate (Ap4A) HIT family hydrolase
MTRLETRALGRQLLASGGPDQSSILIADARATSSNRTQNLKDAKCAGPEWCTFCRALEDSGDMGETTAFRRLELRSVASRTVHRTKHFLVIAGIGPIHPGYLLILTQDHYSSMALIPDELYGELERLVASTAEVLTKCYGRGAIVFEHGPMPLDPMAPSSRAWGGGSCVDHAHFHCVPTDGAVRLHTAVEKQFPGNSFLRLNELQRRASENQAYMFIQEPDGSRFIFDAPYAPSQYLRRVAAGIFGREHEWDWRSYPNAEVIAETVAKVSDQNLWPR